MWMSTVCYGITNVCEEKELHLSFSESVEHFFPLAEGVLRFREMDIL